MNWRKSGSPAPDIMRAIPQNVPTLPTPTTFMATSTSLNRSKQERRSGGSVPAIVGDRLLGDVDEVFLTELERVVEQRRIVLDPRPIAGLVGELRVLAGMGAPFRARPGVA